MGQFCLKMINLTISVALLLTLASSSYGGVTRDTSGFSAFGFSTPVSTSRSASAGFSAFGFSTPEEVEASVSASAGVSGFGFSASASTLSPAFKEQLKDLYDLAVIMEDKAEIFLRRIDATQTVDRRARVTLRDLKNIVFDSFEILDEREENWNEELDNLADAVEKWWLSFPMTAILRILSRPLRLD